MDLSEIGNLGGPSRREMLEDAPSAVVRLWGDGTGTLLLGGAGAKPGARLRLRGASNRGLSIEEAARGRPGRNGERPVPATGNGDVVVVEQARGSGEELLCGPVVARMHDDLRGEVQAVFALARPTRIAVNRFGPTQFVKVLDPSLARRVSTPAEVEAACAEIMAAAWLGGTPGFLVRNAHKPPGRMTQGELSASRECDANEGESPARFARRLVEDERILSQGDGEYALAGGPVELIPTAVLAMGRDQMFREGINLQDPGEARVGHQGRRYVSRGRPQFVPSFVIVGDEPEFRFKAPTGRYARRCVALEPRPGVDPVPHVSVATPVRPIGTRERPRPVTAPVSLFRPEEAAAAAAARAARRGPDPVPLPGQAAPPRPRQGMPAPRTGSGRPAPRSAPPGPALAVMPATRIAAPTGLAELAGLEQLDLDDPGFGP